MPDLCLYPVCTWLKQAICRVRNNSTQAVVPARHDVPEASLQAGLLPREDPSHNRPPPCATGSSPELVTDLDEAVLRLRPYMLAPLYQQILLGLMQAADEVLTQAGIPYWICGGVLIGAIRHGGFIPHDDDLDIECFEADVPRIEEAFNGKPFHIAFERVGEQRSSVMGKLIFHDVRSTGTEIDVFLREPSLLELKEFPSMAETFPLQRLDFNGVSVNAPGGDPISYLRRCYSQEVFSNVRVWNHRVAYLGDEDTEVFVAKSWGLPLTVYNSAVVQLNYEPPRVKETASETFEHFSREGGEIQRLLWERLGWASPMMPPPDALDW